MTDRPAESAEAAESAKPETSAKPEGSAGSNPADQPYRKPFVSDLEIRKAAARVAVAASKKSGRPVSPEVQALADMP